MDSLWCKMAGGIALVEAGVIAALMWSMWRSRREGLRWADECLSLVRTAKEWGGRP